ncbi:tail completion protein gp17 [Yunchengibacter salinarum]|uniref:tail completion protein gp17 n=1 Tax=Yunchengibacter salinarum TaxID=3133399 RepID=UPI0035B6092C
MFDSSLRRAGAALSLEPVLMAVRARLAGDETLRRAGVTVHDDPPETATAPFITFGDSAVRPVPGAGVVASRATFTLVLWCPGSGQSMAQQTMAAVAAALATPLALAGATMTGPVFDGAAITTRDRAGVRLVRTEMTYRTVLTPQP